MHHVRKMLRRQERNAFLKIVDEQPVHALARTSRCRQPAEPVVTNALCALALERLHEGRSLDIDDPTITLAQERDNLRVTAHDDVEFTPSLSREIGKARKVPWPTSIAARP